MTEKASEAQPQRTPWLRFPCLIPIGKWPILIFSNLILRSKINITILGSDKDISWVLDPTNLLYSSGASVFKSPPSARIPSGFYHYQSTGIQIGLVPFAFVMGKPQSWSTWWFLTLYWKIRCISGSLLVCVLRHRNANGGAIVQVTRKCASSLKLILSATMISFVHVDGAFNLSSCLLLPFLSGFLSGVLISSRLEAIEKYHHREHVSTSAVGDYLWMGM